MRTLTRTLFVGLGAIILLGSTGANATTIDFNGLGHGTAVDTQYQGVPWGATISAVNVAGGPDLAVAFDTNDTGTADGDLEDPWSGGNLAANTDLQEILIIQENFNGPADDEAGQPAGTITIAFNQTYDSFGLDLIDIENGEAQNYSIDFYNGGLVASIGFADFTNNASGFYQDGSSASGALSWGNNSANRVDAISLFAFNEVRINFGGSGGIDNLVFEDSGGPGPEDPEIPEPATMALLGLGLAGFAARSRKRRSA